MTTEHKAWLKLIERVKYLEQFAGNRSQLEGFRKMIDEAMALAKQKERE